ncbi:MAG: hypothetical protein MRECE_1c136 [Mycoplasmataceae bacterium CE_OT135]|nr:MAG: hypothetical protein MRECE_1c031 [Mycoplasmataceae bacterium CE_OT135]KLL04360.1 MAG: hypothetical protein MRECE_1c136 [Mycoplasmataceae bacterium CE_OT135]
MPKKSKKNIELSLKLLSVIRRQKKLKAQILHSQPPPLNHKNNLMKCCDICGRKIKQGESILTFKNKTYCVDCRKQHESQGNAPWKNYQSKFTTSLIITLVIFLVLVIGGLIALFWWWKKSARKD